MIQLLKALWSAIGIIESLKKSYDLWNAGKKAKEDAVKIEDAFKNNDSDALNDVFNCVSERKEDQPKL